MLLWLPSELTVLRDPNQPRLLFQGLLEGIQTNVGILDTYLELMNPGSLPRFIDSSVVLREMTAVPSGVFYRVVQKSGKMI